MLLLLLLDGPVDCNVRVASASSATATATAPVAGETKKRDPATGPHARPVMSASPWSLPMLVSWEVRAAGPLAEKQASIAHRTGYGK